MEKWIENRWRGETLKEKGLEHFKVKNIGNLGLKPV